MRARRLVAIVALVVGLVATLVVPPVATAPPAGALSGGGQRIYVYGDSVLVGAQDAIRARLTRQDFRVSVFAHIGANMPEVIRLARSHASSIPNVVVLGVGNNYFGNPIVFREQIDDLMGALGRARRVIWLNLREFRPDRADANAELAAAAHRWPTLEIADWNTRSLTVPGVFYEDGLHLRPKGGELMATLVSERVDSYLAGNPPSKVPVSGPTIRPLSPRVYGYGRSAPRGSRAVLTAKGAVVRHSFVGIASTHRGRGYWLAGADGGVFAAGDARFFGSAGNVRLREPIVDIAATRSGRGYWLVAADGGVFSYGDARFHGSTGAMRLRAPIVGMARTPSGRGYWLVASDGGIFSFGDARFHGSTGALDLAQPVVAMAATGTGRGYTLVANDGGVFTFGDARFHGSTGGRGVFWPIVGIVNAAKSKGYYLLAANGRVYRFGRIRHLGARTDRDIRDLFVGFTARRGGYWLLAQRRA
jgi:hypothetical protein